jgi:hypothetical protein
MTFESVPKPAVVKDADLPEYYVLLCARRYAATVKKFALAATDDERRQHRKSLNYLLESGLIEAKREHEKRLCRYPDDFRKALVEEDGSIISRAISLEEAEILRDALSIPPIASINDLSATDMDGLADMFEGWAQSGLMDSVNVARLLGWADGLRSLAATVGADYTPPETFRGAPVSLLKFMANRMRRSR